MERLKRSTARDRASSRCPVGLCQIVSTMGSTGLGGRVQKNNSPPASVRKTKNRRKTPFLRKEGTNDNTDRLPKGMRRQGQKRRPFTISPYFISFPALFQISAPLSFYRTVPSGPWPPHSTRVKPFRTKDEWSDDPNLLPLILELF